MPIKVKLDKDGSTHNAILRAMGSHAVVQTWLHTNSNSDVVGLREGMNYLGLSMSLHWFIAINDKWEKCELLDLDKIQRVDDLMEAIQDRAGHDDPTRYSIYRRLAAVKQIRDMANYDNHWEADSRWEPAPPAPPPAHYGDY